MYTHVCEAEIYYQSDFLRLPVFVPQFTRCLNTSWSSTTNDYRFRILDLVLRVVQRLFGLLKSSQSLEGQTTRIASRCENANIIADRLAIHDNGLGSWIKFLCRAEDEFEFRSRVLLESWGDFLEKFLVWETAWQDPADGGQIPVKMSIGCD